MTFVPDDFDVPQGLDVGWARLRPLRVEDNEGDFAAWQSSTDHIRSTPGFDGRPWPQPGYTLDRNRADLQEHQTDFATRRGFTYTVVEPDGLVIGCVYIYPPTAADFDGADAHVRSWVRAERADRDGDLYRAVADWLADAWPFTQVSYAPRP